MFCPLSRVRLRAVCGPMWTSACGNLADTDTPNPPRGRPGLNRQDSPGALRRTAPDAIASCPACGQHNTLIALGLRWDHPHHWRFWITALMHLYLCEACDALIEVRNATWKGGSSTRRRR
jgi:hypothetical protein